MKPKLSEAQPQQESENKEPSKFYLDREAELKDQLDREAALKDLRNREAALKIDYNDLKINLFSLPAAMGLTILANTNWVTKTACWYFFSIPIHEFGHAIMAWMSGRFSLPLGAFIPMAGITIIFGQSTFFALIFTACLSFLLYEAIKKHRLFLSLIVFLILVGSVYCSWMLDEKTSSTLVAFAGIGGEFLLSTLLIISFNYHLTDRFRWDFFRFVFLAAGSYAFFSVFWQWIQIYRLKASVPFGSFLSGTGDTGGDIQTLVRAGWSLPYIKALYLKLGVLCLICILLHYYVAVRDHKKVPRTFL